MRFIFLFPSDCLWMKGEDGQWGSSRTARSKEMRFIRGRRCQKIAENSNIALCCLQVLTNMPRGLRIGLIYKEQPRAIDESLPFYFHASFFHSFSSISIIPLEYDGPLSLCPNI